METRKHVEKVMALYRECNGTMQRYLEAVHQYLDAEGLRMSFREFLSLLWTNIGVTCRNTVEFFKVAVRYYGSLSFLKADVSLRLMYLFHNPYKISKRFLMNRGDADIYAYGETPLTTLELIVNTCGIGPSDTVFELGAGRGRTCFWLRTTIGCKVVGIEQIPEFVERSTMIVKRLGMENIEFRCEDMLKASLVGATVCYLYGTCMDDSAIVTLAAKMAKLPPGTKIITVSYPLTDYDSTDSFEVVKRFLVPYPWGTADVYLNVVR